MKNSNAVGATGTWKRFLENGLVLLPYEKSQHIDILVWSLARRMAHGLPFVQSTMLADGESSKASIAPTGGSTALSRQSSVFSTADFVSHRLALGALRSSRSTVTLRRNAHLYASNSSSSTTGPNPYARYKTKQNKKKHQAGEWGYIPLATMDGPIAGR